MDKEEHLARLKEADDWLRGSEERPPDPVEAVARLEDLARTGSAPAMLRLSALTAQGLGRRQDWSEALDLLCAAAERAPPGSVPQRQLQILAGVPAGAATEMRDLRSNIDQDRLLTPPRIERLSDISMVAAVRGFAPAGFCEWIISRVNVLAPAHVAMMGTGEVVQSAARTATHCVFGATTRDVVMAVMMERASRLFGAPIPNHESPQVINYEPGQLFAPHHDWIAPELLANDPRFSNRGQRMATLVTYLNDEFEEGATRFPILDITFRGRPGDAIVFSNVQPNGVPDTDTLHEGAPVKSGRKWVLSQWLRTQPQPVFG